MPTRDHHPERIYERYRFLPIYIGYDTIREAISASVATATWRFTNFVLYCIVFNVRSKADMSQLNQPHGSDVAESIWSRYDRHVVGITLQDVWSYKAMSGEVIRVKRIS